VLDNVLVSSFLLVPLVSLLFLCSEHIRPSAIHKGTWKKVVRTEWSRCEVVTSPRVHQLLAIRRDQPERGSHFPFGSLRGILRLVIKAWIRRSGDLINCSSSSLTALPPFSVSLHNNIRTRVSPLRFWLHRIPIFFSPGSLSLLPTLA
jgi:hypothetical protein